MEAFMTWIRELEATGHLKNQGQPLDPAGKVVRGKKGLVTDGPYVEAKDIVLGFIIVQARDLAQAAELAPVARCSRAPARWKSVQWRTWESREEPAMRRIVMFNRVSADGYFAAADGNLNWVVPDEELEQMGAGSLSGADTILFGRKTYEMFEGFWPKAVSDAPTAPDPHGQRRLSAEARAMGVWINAVTKWVFSRTRKEVTWTNSRLFRELDPHQIETLKRGPGKDIMIFGSGSIVSQLTEHGLIDVYDLVVAPVFLGRGRTLVDGLPRGRKLELTESRSFPSGNVLLQYEPA
jgi:dihydrofolate reductase